MGSKTAGTESAIHVLATTFEATRVALATAIPLARGSDARLIVIVPHASRTRSRLINRRTLSDSTDLLIRRYRDLVTDLGGAGQFRLCLCRRVDDVLTHLLPRRATVVVGGRARGLLPTDETKLVRRMAKLGHHVIFVPMPRNTR